MSNNEAEVRDVGVLMVIVGALVVYATLTAAIIALIAGEVADGMGIVLQGDPTSVWGLAILGLAVGAWLMSWWLPIEAVAVYKEVKNG